MKTSDTLTKFAPAFLEVQKALTSVHKGANNPFFKSKYADLPSVIDAIKPALNDNGFTYIQLPAPSEPGSLCLATRLLHSSGEWIEDTATCPLPKSDPQGYGSAMTYCRRYGLQSVCGLYAEDDDGNAGSGHSSPAPSRSAPVERKPQPAPERRELPDDGLPRWQDQVIHFGKNKGKTLGELPANTLSWYQQEWQPKPYNGAISDDDAELRLALDQSTGSENPY